EDPKLRSPGFPRLLACFLRLHFWERLWPAETLAQKGPQRARVIALVGARQRLHPLREDIPECEVVLRQRAAKNLDGFHPGRQFSATVLVRRLQPLFHGAIELFAFIFLV